MITLPLWIMAQMLRPFFPTTHPWKHQFYGVKEFKERATPLCKQLGCLIWVHLACLIVLTLDVYGYLGA